MRRFALSAENMPPLPAAQKITTGYAYPVKVQVREYQPGLRTAHLIYGSTVCDDLDPIELPLPLDAADALLLRYGPASVIVKHRCKLTIDGLIWEIERYTWPSDPCLIIGAADVPEGAVLPAWVQKEITHDSAYKTESLIILLRNEGGWWHEVKHR